MLMRGLLTGDGEALQAASEGAVDTEIAALGTGDFSAFAAVKVVLSGFTFDEFAGRGLADSFGDGFVGFQHMRGL